MYFLILFARSAIADMGASLSTVKQQAKVPVVAAREQHRPQRTRVSDDWMPVLARNEVLHTVFSFVGIGEYYYVASVCRSWRGRYTTLCKQAAKRRQRKLHTLHMNTVVTASSRLQVALDNGLTVQQLQQNVSDYSLEDAIVELSLEPTAVLSLARVYGLQWTAKLPSLAAEYKQYELLTWLVKCGCTLDLKQIMDFASEDDQLEHMKRLHAITGPWHVHEETCTLMMKYAGLIGSINTLQWWRKLGVAWPTSSFYRVRDRMRSMHDCWYLNCMQWAIANGSTWLTWRCQDLAPDKYSCSNSGCTEHSDDTCSDSCNRKGAAELFKWAHMSLSEWLSLHL
jgi:hypothetical protein